MQIEGENMQNEKTEPPVGKLASIINTLAFMATKREIEIQDLASHLKKDYTSALRVLKRLERPCLVDKRTVGTAVRGKGKHVFQLTLSGLFSYMETDPNNKLASFEEIAHAQNDRLLVFEKWDFFKDKKLDDFIKYRFYTGALRNFQTVSLFNSWILTGQKGHATLVKYRPGEQGHLQITADTIVLGLAYFSADILLVQKALGSRWPEQLRLYRAIEEDYELRSFKNEVLFFIEDKITEEKKALEGWKEFLSRTMKN
jgi:hypothetical protein